MASPTQWTWVWADSGSWWWMGKPGVLQSIWSQRVGHDWATKLKLKLKFTNLHHWWSGLLFFHLTLMYLGNVDWSLRDELLFLMRRRITWVLFVCLLWHSIFSTFSNICSFLLIYSIPLFFFIQSIIDGYCFYSQFLAFMDSVIWKFFICLSPCVCLSVGHTHNQPYWIPVCPDFLGMTKPLAKVIASSCIPSVNVLV